MTVKPLKLEISQNSSSLSITPEIYLRILQKAVQQTAHDIREMETALPVDDFAKVKAVAHKMKGDYDNLRITDMASIAHEIDAIAKSTQDKEKIALLLNDFMMYFEQLRVFIIKQVGG